MNKENHVDQSSQEEYWEEIRASKTQIPVAVNVKGELIHTPHGPYLKIVLISDTHSRLGEIIAQGLIPDGDILIHAGDITRNGEEYELREFNDQIGTLPHKHKLIIAGNHELGLDPEENEDLRGENLRGRGTHFGWKLFTNCTYLHEKTAVIDGVKFYGASWHPLLGYSFYRPRESLKEKWAKIPEDTDVLITHSPPLGYLDVFLERERWGCKYLLEKVEEVQPKLHVFGHVHACYGALSNGPTTFVNASTQRFMPRDIYENIQKHSKVFNKPLIFYIPKGSQ